MSELAPYSQQRGRVVLISSFGERVTFALDSSVRVLVSIVTLKSSDYR